MIFAPNESSFILLYFISLDGSSIFTFVAQNFLLKFSGHEQLLKNNYLFSNGKLLWLRTILVISEMNASLNRTFFPLYNGILNDLIG